MLCSGKPLDALAKKVEPPTVASQNWRLILHPLMICFVLFPVAGQQHRHTPQQSQTCALQAPWRYGIDRAICWDLGTWNQCTRMNSYILDDIAAFSQSHDFETQKKIEKKFPSSSSPSSIACGTFLHTVKGLF